GFSRYRRILGFLAAVADFRFGGPDRIGLEASAGIDAIALGVVRDAVVVDIDIVGALVDGGFHERLERAAEFDAGAKAEIRFRIVAVVQIGIAVIYAQDIQCRCNRDAPRLVDDARAAAEAEILLGGRYADQFRVVAGVVVERAVKGEIG